MIVLASASPRRAELLRAAGIAFEVRAADVDETLQPGEHPDSYVIRLARAKAGVIAAVEARRPVLAADTVVVVNGRILGKPRDVADAAGMLAQLSGRTHDVLTGVCLVAPEVHGAPRAQLVRVATTAVAFGVMSPADIAWYVATGEPMDKAGAYAIQGLASRFVTGIEGSYSNVVGLPVELVCRMCSDLGILVS